MDGFRIKRDDLEEAILSGEEKVQDIESLEEEILKRAADIEEQVASFKEFIAANIQTDEKPELILTKGSIYEECFIADMSRLKETLNAEKEELSKTLEDNKEQ